MPQKKRVQIGKELAAVRRSLRALDKSLALLSNRLRGTLIKRPAKSAPKPGRSLRLKLSPTRLAALRLHGRYLGYLRQLKPRAKAQVRALRAKNGVRAAIAQARKLAGK